jgi:hypothetical protein
MIGAALEEPKTAPARTETSVGEEMAPDAASAAVTPPAVMPTVTSEKPQQRVHRASRRHNQYSYTSSYGARSYYVSRTWSRGDTLAFLVFGEFGAATWRVGAHGSASASRRKRVSLPSRKLQIGRNSAPAGLGSNCGKAHQPEPAAKEIREWESSHDAARSIFAATPAHGAALAFAGPHNPPVS